MAKKSADSQTSVIYARYSSHAQKDASIEQQVEKCMEYARANNLVVTRVYSDRALSGKSDRRPDFQRMMRDAEKGGFDVVIAWKSNRIGRNMMQALINEAKLSDMGIRCQYVEEDFDDSAAGRFALRSMMNVNQFYSENMAEDILRGLYDNAKDCKVNNGRLAYGFYKGEDGRYAVNEAKAEIIREIYGRVACGDSLSEIARDLNARGIKTSRGKTWSVNSFRVLLTNERYRGVYLYGNVRTEGGIPRIVSDDLFERVQTVLKTKKNPRGRGRINGEFLLSGKVFCGLCGSNMTGSSGTSKTGAKHYYYACAKHRHNPGSCRLGAIKRDLLENTVAEVIREDVLQDEVIEWIADSTIEYNRRREEQSELALLEQELADVKKAARNIMAAIEQGIITPTTKARLMEVEERQAELDEKIRTEKAGIVQVPRDVIVAGLQMFRDGAVSDRKYMSRLFDTFLRAVYVYDDTLKIVFTFSGDSNTKTVPLSPQELNKAYQGSTSMLLSPPLSIQANPSIIVTMIGGIFIVTCPKPHK